MVSVFLYHVVGDLTVGKPEMVEFYETETVESAIRAIGESTECGIPRVSPRRTGSVGEVSGGEVALDVDETIFVAVAEDVERSKTTVLLGGEKLLQQEGLLALRPSSCSACLLE
ncbi:hypothetical protein Bca4012_009459 [Brassica carinata]|uniref:Uncharacterized protein n=1 Tax=Brassica carinata TaxID=52824 RepID=A0A8X7S3S5_BRACI|nr:hypothetical protein Bca52824_034727 [Brassica carinata]